jgi:hypothetical protein
VISFRVSSIATAPVTGIRIFEDFSGFSIVNEDEKGSVRILANVINPLSYPTRDHEIAKYKVALFTHRNWPEARILNLQIDGQRVGLLFSLQALASEQGVLPSRTLWNEAGFIALQKICLGEYDYGPVELAVPKSDPAAITEILSDDTIVLILDEASCLQAMPWEAYQTLIERCLPSLAKYGFYRLDRDSKPGDFRANALGVESTQATLMLRPYSPELPPDAVLFFSNMILTSAQREQNPAFRLFLGYQMIEILMADILGRIVRDFANQAAKTASTVELMDLKDELMADIKDKDRIGRVFNANRGPETNDAFDELHRSCDVMLNCLRASEPKDSSASKNVETALYSVRNQIVHSYSKVGHLEIELEEIAQRVFILLCELSVAYKSPNLTGN